ncbi:hypothetical protein PhCBS80983_g02191 [Powellomyces hirtus]|uniref:SDE2-like domain-containing protein n=1 Tax=Powellomyces hirtus TaxID=109895 RepID=A0A507E6V9_9FUNG|nr:hypothetical protein PhCBS80983_g02191 [Powellomyces hirtus]
MASSQVIVNLFSGLQPLCLQFPADADSTPTISDLKYRIFENLPIGCQGLRLTTQGGCSVDDADALFEHEESGCPPVFNLLVRIPGGKGGFGSMLRAQGGKMASQKTTNFEACRDLSGRRLKTVNDAKKLADYLEKEPERKRKRQEETIQKLEKKLKEPEKQKIRFHDPDFVQNHQDVLDDVQEAVEKALRDVPATTALATRKDSPPAAKRVPDLSQWDAESEPEDDSEDEDEEESDGEEVWAEEPATGSDADAEADADALIHKAEAVKAKA